MHNLEVTISFSGFLAFFFLVFYNRIDTSECQSWICVTERAFASWTVNVWLMVIIISVFMRIQERYNRWLVYMNNGLLYFGVICCLILINLSAWNFDQVHPSHHLGHRISAIGTSALSVFSTLFMIYDLFTRHDWEEQQKRAWVIKGNSQVVIKAEDIEEDDETKSNQPVVVQEITV